MISNRLVTHTLSTARMGTRTSDAGDTVDDGVYATGAVTGQECIAEETSGFADATPARTRDQSTWVILVNPGLDIQARDQVTLTPGPVVAIVDEVRSYSRPESLAHMRLTCTEVIG